MRPFLRTVLPLILAGAFLHAAAPDASREAFKVANKLTDPAARLAALRQVAKQYPGTGSAGRANDQILQLLVRNFPSETAEIDKQIKVLLKGEKGESRAYALDGVANALADGNLMLAAAEKYSQKSIALIKEKEYIRAEQKAYTDAHMTPPDEASSRGDYLRVISGLEATLGRVKFKEGEIGPSKALLDKALREDPDNSTAAAYRGEIAAKEGNEQQALTHLTRARLTGKLERSQEELLASLYQKLHPDSSNNLDAYLDASYARLFPNPVRPARFKGKEAGRTVLAELFTGAGCGPCAGADLALEAIMERYPRSDLAVVEYDEHIPEPDPLTCPEGVQRFGFYQGTGTPTAAIDGQTSIVGASRSDAKKRFDELDSSIQQALQKAPEAAIALNIARNGDAWEAKASASAIKGNWKNLHLDIALVENELRYSGENGIRLHLMVVRSMADFSLAKDGGSFRQVFDTAQISSALKHYLEAYELSNDRFGPITFIQKMNHINPANVSVVAFIQDADSKHVLQAKVAPLKASQ
jgi:hypothetical protein